ncbi:MAG TPA: hypothetical protein PKA13_08590 [Geminicoccaceae bacterium]|nr:hypothetical protein [Geminicoccus sp.]HMU49820.1 hypothetical protein [Geminicoccaceae bacterium]
MLRRHLLLLTALAAVPGRAMAAPRLRIRDLYVAGAEFSPEARSLDGKPVVMQGFMAPPLKPDIDFFVLTKLPMAVCPFCDSEMDWPADIVVVRLRKAQDWVDFNTPILVTGRLELGTVVDEGTGFVSRVRLVDAAYELS